MLLEISPRPLRVVAERGSAMAGLIEIIPAEVLAESQ
jgi:hypothetical protein